MFPLKLGSEVRLVTKIQAGDFTSEHRDTLAQAGFQSGRLVLPDSRWTSQFLGAGEEKAVFCICDHHNRVFALELLDERTYLDGRFAGGQYFGDLRVPGLVNRKLNPASEFGLMFTGKVKAREFVYGYEWSRFQWDPRRLSWFDRLLTAYLRSLLSTRFDEYRLRYKDVHDRNVLFELRPRNEPGVPVIIRDWTGRICLARVGLQPIDVR